MADLPRVALVHDWLTGMRGGEYVLEAIAELFPKSDLFTLIYVPGKIAPVLTTLKRHTSFLQRLPNAEKRYRHFLPLMPLAIERMDLKSFDLIISSSHCVAKGIQKSPDAVHVSYVHAPMRYMWDRYEDYFGKGKASAPVRFAASLLRKPLQNWDRAVSSPERVDTLVANSHFIASQMEAAYGRKSEVVHPFADLSRFTIPRTVGKNYLMVGAFAPNKRVDLAIEAFNELKLPLIIVGTGQEEKRLKKMAGPTIEFLGSLSNPAIADLYSKCKAFIFPGVEDFGITPLEAMAAGAPVIAYGEGGALETITEKSGAFFKPQTAQALMHVIRQMEAGELSWKESDCRAQAAQFNRERFQRELLSIVRATWIKRGKSVEAFDALLKKSWAPWLSRA